MPSAASVITRLSTLVIIKNINNTMKNTPKIIFIVYNLITFFGASSRLLMVLKPKTEMDATIEKVCKIIPSIVL